MEHCARTLAESREYPTDALIPSFVQAQDLSRRAIDALSYDDLTHSEVRGVFVTTVTIESLLRDLERLREDLTIEMQRDCKLHVLRPILKLLTLI